MFGKLNQKGKLFEAGEFLFHEGDASDELYFIIEGAVEIVKTSGEDETSLAVFCKGDIFGEMAFFDQKPRSASARLLTDSNILVITKAMMDNQLDKLPSWITSLIRIIINRLRTTNERLATFLLKEKTSQTVATLIDIAKAYGQQNASEVKLNLGLAQKFMANKLGLSLAEAETSINRLTDKKLVRIGDAHAKKQLLIIPDISKLQDYVNYLEKKNKFTKESNPKLDALFSSEKDLHLLDVILRVVKKIGQPQGQRLVVNIDSLRKELGVKAGVFTNFEEVFNILEELALMVMIEDDVYLEKEALEKIIDYSYLKKEFQADIYNEGKEEPPLMPTKKPESAASPKQPPPSPPPPIPGGEIYKVSRVDREKLEPGMILAKPILNNTDRVILFEEGVKLTAEIIGQIMKLPHVFEVEIKTDHKRY